MNAVVLGNGFLGKQFARNGWTVWDRSKFSYEKEKIHTDWNKLSDFDTIINCIGLSDTRLCEHSLSLAMDINGELPKILSQYCDNNFKKFVHISTGCLYDHENANENDFIVAHCNYTVSKWIGEKGCRANDLIIRPRLLYSDLPNKNNLLSKLPRYKSYVYDKKDSLTSTQTIVQAVTALLKNNQSGIFNVADEGILTMSDIAGLLNIKLNKPIITMEHLRRTQGLYLVNSTMNINKLKEFYQPPTIIENLIYCYKNLKINEKYFKENMVL
jgi:dTDP-4-dehydrorhamnose reductase